tara:strand:- start:5653 stop:6957 length:1305 start_codon:yes stop_codon:yes gene_type:complete
MKKYFNFASVKWGAFQYIQTLKFAYTLPANIINNIFFYATTLVITPTASTFNQEVIKPFLGVSPVQIADAVQTIKTSLNEGLMEAYGETFRVRLHSIRFLNKADTPGEIDRLVIFLKKTDKDSTDNNLLPRNAFDDCTCVLASLNLPKISIYWKNNIFEIVAHVDLGGKEVADKDTADLVKCVLELNVQQQIEINLILKKNNINGDVGKLNIYAENASETANVQVRPGNEAVIVQVTDGPKGDKNAANKQGSNGIVHLHVLNKQNLLTMTLRGQPTFYAIHTIDENKTQRVAGYLTPGERPRSYKLDALPYNINYTGEMQDGAKHLRDFYQYKENMPLQNVLLLRSRKSVSLSNAIKDPISEFIESAITQPLDAFKKETEREINTSAIQSFVIRVVGVILLGVFVMSVSSTLTSEYIRDKFRKKNGEKKQIKNR